MWRITMAMGIKGHIWFRNGWLRSKDRTARSLVEWLKRMNRLAITGTRARVSGREELRIEDGGMI